MQAIECAGSGRKSGEALGVVLSADSPEKLQGEFGQAKQALLAWNDKHGSACSTVMLTLIASPESYEAITRLLDHAYREDVELSPLLQRVAVKVAILNSKRKLACQYRLGNDTPQFKAEPDKPWWKFW